MKRNLSILMTVLLVFAMAASVMAAPLDKYHIDDDTATLTVFGTIDGAGKGDPITIEILKKGKTIDPNAEYTGNKILSDFILFTQVPANKEGGYEISVSMTDENGDPRETGFYTMRVNGKETDKRIYFAPSTEKYDFLDDVDEICYKEEDVAVEELVELFDTANSDSKAINMFNITYKYLLTANAETLARSFYRMVFEGEPIGTPSSFSDAICKAAFIAALNDGKEVDITEYAKEFDLDEEYVAIYKTNVNDENKKDFANDYYKGKNRLVPRQIKTAFNEAVQLAFYESFDSAYDVETFITTFGKDLGVDMKDYGDLKTKYKTKLYTAVLEMGKVSGMTTLVKKINDKVDDLLEDQEDSDGDGKTSGNGFTSVSTSDPIVAGGVVAASKFSDMAGNEWAIEAVNVLANKGVVNGVGGDKFAPGREVTREEMLAMLLRAYSVNVTGVTTDKFSDVDASAWYAPYVAKAVAEGWVNGISETEFGTGKYVTREEAATMAFRISRAFGKQYISAADKFSDETEMFDYSKEAVYSLAGIGVINGMGDGTFSPKTSCTRAQSAKIIYSLIN